VRFIWLLDEELSSLLSVSLSHV